MYIPIFKNLGAIKKKFKAMIQRNIIPIKGLKNTKGSIFSLIEEKIPAPYVFYSIKTKNTQK